MSEPDDWRPGADAGVLRERAALLAAVRVFMAERGILEVDTPILARTTVTDPAIESVRAGGGGAGGGAADAGTMDPGWLQTSPEYFMKRLLAAGSGPIYQLAHAFRAGESGRLHNPEFLILEWYRPGFDDGALMDEMDALFAGLFGARLPGAPEVGNAPAFGPGSGTGPRREPGPGSPGIFPARRVPFRTLIETELGVDALRCGDEALAAAVTDHWRARGEDGDPLQLAAGERGVLLDLAYSEALSRQAGACFVTDFPPEQAALARLRRDAAGDLVAARFELVVEGVELANGFHELLDAGEQQARFAADQQRRRARGQVVPEADKHLLAALASGLPDCAGVAVGLDRVLMLRLGRGSLDAVLPFSWPRC